MTRATLCAVGIVVMVALALAGCGGGDGDAVSNRLTVLSDVAPIQESFDADSAHARLVLILSPT